MEGVERKCAEEGCGGELQALGHTQIVCVGKVTVTDRSSTAFVCETCKKVNLTLDELHGYELRAARTVLADGKHVDGSVMRFARKALGLSQKELGVLLDRKDPAVSRWETGADESPRSIQLALAHLLQEVENGNEIHEILRHEEEDDGPNSDGGHPRLDVAV